MFLSNRQAGYSNRQQKQPRPGYKCEVSGRYFVVGGQMAGCVCIKKRYCNFDQKLIRLVGIK